MPVVPDTPANRSRAAALMKAGRVVAFPTDTLYGLGALIWDEDAVRQVFDIKGRGGGQGLPVLLSTPDQLADVAADVPEQALALGRAFWPGALTLVVRRTPGLPAIVTGGLDTVAVRVPAHPAPLALIAEAGAPITGTSANLHGGGQPVTAREVQRQLDERPALILDGGRCEAAAPSTILDVTVLTPRILRQGAISVESIREVCDVEEA